MKFKLRLSNPVSDGCRQSAEIEELKRLSKEFNLRAGIQEYPTWTAFIVDVEDAYIEIASIDDLVYFLKIAGGLVVLEYDEFEKDQYVFEIYNGYRE